VRRRAFDGALRRMPYGPPRTDCTPWRNGRGRPCRPCWREALRPRDATSPLLHEVRRPLCSVPGHNGSLSELLSLYAPGTNLKRLDAVGRVGNYSVNYEPVGWLCGDTPSECFMRDCRSGAGSVGIAWGGRWVHFMKPSAKDAKLSSSIASSPVCSNRTCEHSAGRLYPI